MAQGEISCVGISKTFSTGHQALSSIDLTIPTKGIFSLIGKNGAGKTTLTRILSTLLEPTSGKATIDGLDIMKDADKLRERMAIVPQEGRPVAWMTPQQSIISYLMWRGFDYRESRRKADEVIAKVGLSGHGDKLNRNLSGGMKRKVLVAMVIASDCEFIFLDEPSTGLDPISRRDMWELLTRIGQERFLFLTTHYLEEAERIADRIGVVHQGRILRMGTMDDLRKHNRYSYRITVNNGQGFDWIRGESVRRRDGWTQIMTTEDEALAISRELIRKEVRFSINPVTLDDIFSYIVKSSDRSVAQEELE